MLYTKFLLFLCSIWLLSIQASAEDIQGSFQIGRSPEPISEFRSEQSFSTVWTGTLRLADQHWLATDLLGFGYEGELDRFGLRWRGLKYSTLDKKWTIRGLLGFNRTAKPSKIFDFLPPRDWIVYGGELTWQYLNHRIQAHWTFHSPQQDSSSYQIDSFDAKLKFASYETYGLSWLWEWNSSFHFSIDAGAWTGGDVVYSFADDIDTLSTKKVRFLKLRAEWWYTPKIAVSVFFQKTSGEDDQRQRYLSSGSRTLDGLGDAVGMGILFDLKDTKELPKNKELPKSDDKTAEDVEGDL